MVLLVGFSVLTGLVLWLRWQGEHSSIPLIPLQPATPIVTTPDGTTPGGTNSDQAPSVAAAGPVDAPERIRAAIADRQDERVASLFVRVLLAEGPGAAAATQPMPFVDVQVAVAGLPVLLARSDGQGRARFDLVGGHGRTTTVRTSLGSQATAQLSADAPVEVSLHLVARAIATGMVVDEQGRGTADADLLFLPWEEPGEADPPPRRVGRSAADGSFRVALATGGRLGAAHASYGPSPMFLVRPAPAGRDPNTRTLQLTLCTHTGNVAGFVLGQDGLPLPAAEIELRHTAAAPEGADLAAPPVRVRSDEHGAFLAANVPAGAIDYRVRCPGHGRVHGKLTLAPGAMHKLQVTLTGSCRLRGTMTDEAGNPLAGAQVAVGGAGAFPPLRATTDAKGCYEVTELAPGLLAVQARHGSTGGPLLQANGEVELRPTEVAEWHAVLTAAAIGNQLLGHLVDARGEPLPGWRVLAHQPRNRSAVASTGSDGGFRIPLPKARTVDLRAFAPGRDLTHFADSVLLGVDSSSAAVRFVAGRGSFTTARGRVVGATGAGLPATIRCWHLERSEYVEFPTTGEGAFDLREVPAGTLDVEFHAPRSTRVCRHGVRAQVGADLDFGDIVLEPGASLRGLVLGPNGASVDDVHVQVVAKDADWIATYDAGRYQFAALPAGTHRLQVQAPGVAAATFEVTVHAGQDLERDIQLAQRCLGVAGDVLGRLQHAERPAAFCMRLALGHLFSVEVRHLLEKVHVVQHDRSIGADCQRVAIARCGRAGPSGRANSRQLAGIVHVEVLLFLLCRQSTMGFSPKRGFLPPVERRLPWNSSGFQRGSDGCRQ